jgi:hypothetical protein
LPNFFETRIRHIFFPRVKEDAYHRVLLLCLCMAAHKKIDKFIRRIGSFLWQYFRVAMFGRSRLIIKLIFSPHNSNMAKPITPTSLYLAAYNLLSALGWALVLRSTCLAYLAGLGPAELWAQVGDSLCLVQTAAALEILHSLLRLTRSPLAATVMQVRTSTDFDRL